MLGCKLGELLGSLSLVWDMVISSQAPIGEGSTTIRKEYTASAVEAPGTL